MRKASALVALLAILFVPTACASGGGPQKEVINPAGGEVTTPFAPIVRTGNLYFLSGVIGRSATGDIGEATRQALESIQQRLQAVDLTLDDMVKCTVFLIDMDDYQEMNRVYAEYFPSNPPARSAVAVRALPAAAQVEIECIGAGR